jgi:hypothetical protein
MKSLVKIIIFVVFIILLIFIFKKLIFKTESDKIGTKPIDVISNLRQAANLKNISFSEIKLNNDFDIVATYQGIKILFSSAGDFEKKILSLQKVLKSTKMKTGVKEIDLRFNKIILR